MSINDSFGKCNFPYSLIIYSNRVCQKFGSPIVRLSSGSAETMPTLTFASKYFWCGHFNLYKFSIIYGFWPKRYRDANLSLLMFRYVYFCAFVLAMVSFYVLPTRQWFLCSHTTHIGLGLSGVEQAKQWNRMTFHRNCQIKNLNSLVWLNTFLCRSFRKLFEF